jgi:hypothetical protein
VEVNNTERYPGQGWPTTPLRLGSLHSLCEDARTGAARATLSSCSHWPRRILLPSWPALVSSHTRGELRQEQPRNQLAFSSSSSSSSSSSYSSSSSSSYSSYSSYSSSTSILRWPLTFPFSFVPFSFSEARLFDLLTYGFDNAFRTSTSKATGRHYRLPHYSIAEYLILSLNTHLLTPIARYDDSVLQ